jgi:enamine deaminase RidA (YjgF/YER057c/UK114 family)
MVSMLASLSAELGDLGRVTRVIRLTGYVSSSPEFIRQPEVVDGASDLVYAIWGRAGVHARTAIGVSSLPGGIPVEVEGIFQLEPDDAS